MNPARAIRHAVATDGAIVECRMGLTTILIGAGATRSGTPHLALELALARLGARTQRYAARYGPIRRSESYVDRPSAGEQGG